MIKVFSRLVYKIFGLFIVLFSHNLAAKTITNLPNPAIDRLNYIVEQAPKLIYENNEQAYLLIKEGLSFATGNEFEIQRAILLNQLSIYHYLNTNYGMAVSTLDSAIKLNLKHSQIEGLVNNFNNKGYVYKVVGNYTVALDNYLESVKILDQVPNHQLLATPYINIGNIHKLLKNHFTAIDYFEKAIRYAEQNKNFLAIANAYHNLGEVYFNMNELVNAILFFNKTIEIIEQHELSIDPTNTYSNLAQVLKKQGKINEALFYQHKVLQLTREKKFSVGTIKALLDLGDTYFIKGQYATAEKYLVEGIFEATAIKRFDIIGNAYYTLSGLYEKTGNFKKALALTRRGAMLNDSLLNAEKNRQLVEMQTLFETEKLKKDAELLYQKSLQNEAKITSKTQAIVFMVVTIILLVLLSILYGSYAKIKSRANKGLEKMVQERTAELERKEKILTIQNKKLMAYAHLTSHTLRRPLANILGLVNLYEISEPHERNEMEFIEIVKDSAIEMDETVIKSIEILSEKFDEKGELEIFAERN